MNLAFSNWLKKDESGSPPDIPPQVAEQNGAVEVELAKYLPHLSRMSGQLKETSAQIETAVVGVCDSFHGIARRAQETVARTAGFLSRDGDNASGGQPFEELIENCGKMLVKILRATEEAGETSRRAIERIQQIEKVSQGISAALIQLNQIANGNKMLAINARIEAAHAGSQGAGFAVVAGEVVSLTEKSQKVTAHVSDMIVDLRTLAESTLDDLKDMSEQEHSRVEQSRREVDESLKEMQATHGEMKRMLTGMTDDGALLAKDIGAAVRGLQFQDRISQRIGHVVEDLGTLQARLTARFGEATAAQTAAIPEFSSYTMQEERKVAGMDDAESAQGDVELF